MLFLEKFFVPTKFTVTIAGICALILTMGIAHYAFAPMIPYMLEQTPMTKGLSNLLSIASYMGLIGGLALVWLIHDNFRLKDFIYRYALFIAVAATITMALLDHFAIWMLARLLSGLVTAFGLLLSIDLIVKWLDFNNEKRDLRLFFTGIGFAVLVSAFVVSLMNGFGWRGQWIALIVISFLFAGPAFFLMPLPKTEQLIEKNETDSLPEPSFRWLALLTAAFVCAGFSNAINPVFSLLITEYITIENDITYMWFWLGLAALAAPFFWDVLANLLGSIKALMIAFAVLIFSNVLMSLSLSGLSSLFFGFSFVGIITLTLTLVIQKYEHKATRIMAQLVIGFVIAHIIASAFVIGIASLTDSFGLSLYFINGILVLGVICLDKMNSE